MTVTVMAFLGTDRYEGVESSGTEESGSDGSFQLTGLAGKVEITAVKDGWVFVPDVVTKARDNVLVRGSRQTVDLSVHVIEFGPTKICEVTVREVKGLPGALKFTLLDQEVPAANSWRIPNCKYSRGHYRSVSVGRKRKLS